MENPLPRRLLIPVDVAEFRKRAFRLGTHLAQLNKAEIILLTVIDDRFPYPDIFSFHLPNQDYYKYIRGRAREILEKVAREAPAGIRIRPVVARGTPSKVIVEVAEKEGVDLIIMTSHTARGLEHVLLGSVTDKVLRSATCPVLVMPIKERKTPEEVAEPAPHE